jgi:hypothetical protein
MNNEPRKPVSVQIDMTADGRFASPPPGGTGPVTNRVLRAAIIVAALATIGVVAALALWVALALIPIAIGAALLAYGILRFRLWRAGVSVGRQRSPFRR